MTNFAWRKHSKWKDKVKLIEEVVKAWFRFRLTTGGEHATEMLSYRRGKRHAYKILEHMYMNPNDPFQGHPSANSLFMVGQV